MVGPTMQQQIANWLKSLGLGEYAQRFAENRIDASVLRDLTDEDLEKICILLGHRKKMLRAIAELDGAVLTRPALASCKVTTASSRISGATEYWPIWAIRARMKTMPSAPCGRRSISLPPLRGSRRTLWNRLRSALVLQPAWSWSATSAEKVR